MMNPNNFTNGSCFSAIFDPSDENYPEKETCIKKGFWLQGQALYFIAQIAKMTMGPRITV